VEERILSEPEGPEDLQNRSQPRQGPGLGISLAAPRQPRSEAGERSAKKGASRLGRVQAARPAAERAGVGHAIWVFERGHRLFPGAVLHEASPQRLTSSQQAVMGVRERKQREEGEGRPATVAATAPDFDPVVILIVRLLAVPHAGWPMIESRSHTGHRRRMTSAQPVAQSLSSLRGGAESGIKRIVAQGGSASALTCQDLSRKRSPSS